MAKKRTAARDESLKKTLNKWWAEASQEISESKLSESESKDLDTLFTTRVWGHREVLITVLLAMSHDNLFKASADLYACNPRSVYGNVIKPFLRSKGVPCNQDGVLNVAKGANSLDEYWAAQRSPSQPAEALIRLVRVAEKDGSKKLKVIAINLLSKFASEASGVRLSTPSAPSGLSSQNLSRLLRELVFEVVDSGNTAQTICAALVQVLNPLHRVLGYGERASTTNTTSNKPGDVVVYGPSNEPLMVYEVTQKDFSLKRINESLDSLQAYGDQVKQINVICPADNMPGQEVFSGLEGELKLRAVDMGGVTFQFFPLDLWIDSQVFSLNLESRKLVLDLLHTYVSNPQTSSKLRQTYGEKITALGLV